MEVAHYQQKLHLLKTAQSSTRYRRVYSPAAAPNLAAAIRCRYEHDEERVSGFIKGRDGLRLGWERPDLAIARSSDAEMGLNDRGLQRLWTGSRLPGYFCALRLVQNRSSFERPNLADLSLVR